MCSKSRLPHRDAIRFAAAAAAVVPALAKLGFVPSGGLGPGSLVGWMECGRKFRW